MTTPTETIFPDLESLRNELIALRRAQMTWREIRATALFYEIPIGTLHRFYRGEDLPRHYWERFGIKRPSRNRIAISKDNMTSAARTIINNVETEKVAELVRLLKERIK